MTWFIKGSKHEGKSPSNHLSLTGIYAIPQSLGFSSLEKPCIKVKKREQKSKRKKTSFNNKRRQHNWPKAHSEWYTCLGYPIISNTLLPETSIICFGNLSLLADSARKGQTIGVIIPWWIENLSAAKDWFLILYLHTSKVFIWLV